MREFLAHTGQVLARIHELEALAAGMEASQRGFLITGSFIIEYIFAIPGIGKYYVDAVEARDYSVVMGLTVLLSIIVILANLVVDILYGFLDPRTREART
jgi:ABC-type dipeptide/oligopeptide/nickel transport system permease component